MEKTRDWKNFGRLIRIARLPKFWIAGCMLACLADSELALLFPSYTQQIIAGDYSARIITLMVLCLFGQVFLDMGYQCICQYTSAKIARDFRHAIWSKLMKMSYSFYNKEGSDEFISRVTDDTESLSSFCTDSISGFIAAVYSFFATMIILFNYDWHLLAAELILIPMIVAVGLLKGKVDFKWNYLLQMKVAELTGQLSEILDNIPLAKVFVQEKKAEKSAEEKINGLYVTKMKLLGITTIFSGASTVISVLETIILIVFGVVLIRKNIITVDIWVAFYMYSTNLTGKVDTIMTVWDELKTGQGAMKRIAEVASIPDEDMTTGEAVPAEVRDLEFRHVSFSYGEEGEKQVLKDISFCARAGQTTAIIGDSGAGKTTILNLVERFYRPRGGEILYGDRDAASYNCDSWRKNIGYVTQDTWLIGGSILDNLTYGVDREVSKDGLIEDIGTHAELMERGGLYCRLYRIQRKEEAV